MARSESGNKSSFDLDSGVGLRESDTRIFIHFGIGIGALGWGKFLFGVLVILGWFALFRWSSSWDDTVVLCAVAVESLCGFSNFLKPLNSSVSRCKADVSAVGAAAVESLWSSSNLLKLSASFERKGGLVSAMIDCSTSKSVCGWVVKLPKWLCSWLANSCTWFSEMWRILQVCNKCQRLFFELKVSSLENVRT